MRVRESSEARSFGAIGRRLTAVAMLVSALLATAIPVQATTAAPSEPGSLITGFRSTYQEAFKVVVTWDRVDGAAGYRLRQVGSRFDDFSSDNWHVFRFLQGDTEYRFEVAPVFERDGDFVEGVWSEPITVRTPLAELRTPTIELDYRYGRAPIRNDLIILSVAEYRPVIATYEWFRDGESLGVFATTRFFDDTVVQGSTYRYTVREVRNDGATGPMSGAFFVTVPGTPPGVPLPAPDVRRGWLDTSRAVFYVGSAGGSSGALPAPNGAQAHEVWRDGVLLADDVNAWFTDKNLRPEVTYEYQFRAIAVDGTRGEWTAIEVTTASRN